MTPTPMPRSESRRMRAVSSAAVGALLACLFLLAPGAARSILADDQKPPADDREEQPSKESGTAAKSAPQAKPSPTPGTPSKAGPGAAARKQGSAEKPPPKAPAPVLRFDDFDLEKYHKPLPKAEDEEAEEGGSSPAGDEAIAPSAAPPVPPAQPARPQRKPRPLPEEPAQDPLKSFKDREAREKFRQMQIETGRERIAKLQARLDFLRAKRDAVASGGFDRAFPPPQTDEDKERDKTLKAKDLLKQIEEEIKTTEEEIDTARGELASVETRFAHESQSR